MYTCNIFVVLYSILVLFPLLSLWIWLMLCNTIMCTFKPVFDCYIYVHLALAV